MENLRRMALFASVVDASSFTGAARRQGLSRSAVSRQVALLEDELGVRLLNRTTRTLSLTEAGEAYYQSCARIVAEAREASRKVRRLHDRPTGTLRVNGPVIGHQLLVASVARYLELYPQISVELTLDDQYVNLVEQGIDVAVRIGHPADSSMVARRLAEVRQVICGSPAYFAGAGVPRHPRELAQHQWITYSLLASPERFVFSSGRTRQTVRVSGRLRSNGGPAIRDALLAGLGLTLIPRFYVAADLASGRLQAVLEEHQVKLSALYAVYPHRTHLARKVRLFIDLLADQAELLMPRSIQLNTDVTPLR